MQLSESNTWTDQLLARASRSREEDGLFLVEHPMRRKPGLATARTGGASCANHGFGVPTPPQTGASPSSPGAFLPSKGAPGASPPPSTGSVLPGGRANY